MPSTVPTVPNRTQTVPGTHRTNVPDPFRGYGYGYGRKTGQIVPREMGEKRAALPPEAKPRKRGHLELEAAVLDLTLRALEADSLSSSTGERSHAGSKSLWSAVASCADTRTISLACGDVRFVGGRLLVLPLAPFDRLGGARCR